MDPVTIIAALAQFAPSLIKWATGSDSAGTIASKALDVAKIVTGAQDLDTATAALKADPTLQVQFQQQILQQESDFEALYVKDKADARARDIALAATPRGNVRANWLVAFAILTITGCLIAVIFLEFKDEWAKGVIMLVLGMYISELKNIYSFEFGTTRRSREKSDVIDSLK